MRRVIVGTAGHIDHGKTKLVEALTGIDCDRWAEEKRRGITIDLGFAHLEEGDLQIGFVDVPGHERFLHNALAGLGGIRIMLLVVAADEGVKPQTREHLDICSLLGIPAGVVALSKADLVGPDLLELAKLEIEELLAGGRFAGSRVLQVSSLSGEGVPELKRALVELAEAFATASDPSRPPRLPIDRAFHLKGRGVVVTGTLASGELRAGDMLEVAPAGGSARVRSIQVHGAGREVAEAGERTALQLSGIDLDDLWRGAQLIAPGSLEETSRLVARFTLLAEAPRPIRGSTPVRFHLYSSEVLGRLRPLGRGGLEPGDSGAVEIRLRQPVVAVRGDRFIVRRPSPAATMGGGEILDPAARRRRGKALDTALAALDRGVEGTILLWIREAGEGGAEGRMLARRLGRSVAQVEPTLDALVSDQRLLEVRSGGGRPRRWVTPATFRGISRRAERVLGDYFRRERLSRGMPKAEAVERILPGGASELADTYLEWLEAQEVLVVSGGLVNLPGRTAQLTGEESKLVERVLDEFERGGLTPPSPAEIRDRLAVKTQILQGVIGYLTERGRLVQIPGQLIVHAAAVARLREQLEASGWERFTVGQFKQRFALTRKWAIPLLEHLDSIGATRRIGDERQIVRRAG